MMHSCTRPKIIHAAIVSLLVLLSTLTLLVKLDIFDKDEIVDNSNLFSHLRKLQSIIPYASVIPYTDNLPTADEAKVMGLLSSRIYDVNETAPVVANILPNNYVANEEDWIDIESTQAMIVRSSYTDSTNHLVVTFKGSVSLFDMLNNLNWALTPIDYGDIPTDIYVHQGYRNVLMEDGIIEEIEEKVLNSLNDQSLNLSHEIYVTGHSLGGALAQLFGAYWAHKYPENSVKMISFGQPSVGASGFKTWTEEELTNFNQIRFVYRNDPAPRLKSSVNIYRHSGHNIQIEDEGVTAYYRHNGDDDTYDGVPIGWDSVSMIDLIAWMDHDTSSYLPQLELLQSGELTLPTNFKMTEEEVTCWFWC